MRKCFHVYVYVGRASSVCVLPCFTSLLKLSAILLVTSWVRPWRREWSRVGMGGPPKECQWALQSLRSPSRAIRPPTDRESP